MGLSSYGDFPAPCKENIAGNSSTLVGKAAEAFQRVGAKDCMWSSFCFAALEALTQQVGQKHSANEGVKMQMHQMLFGRPASY